MRTIKIYSGMTEEYEIIRTDAPNQVIEEQLKRYYDGEPYELLTNSGYAVVPSLISM